MNALESVLGKLTKRQMALEADFDRMVSELADGKEPDAKKLADILEQSVRTPDNLRQAVEALTERRRLRVVFDAAEPARKRVAEIDVALGKIEVRREAADKKCDAEAWPLTDEREQLQAAIVAADDARRKLYSSCYNPEILDRAADIRQELESIATELMRLSDDRTKFEGFAARASERATLVGQQSDGQRAQYATDAKTYAANVEDLVGQIAELEAKQSRLKAESAELDARRLEP